MTVDKVVKSLHQPLATDHFLRGPAARRLVAEGALIDYELQGGDAIASPRLPFVSFPYEWCDAQLHAAARLTLELARETTTHGHELKDASAWNVIFDGAKPRFCDLTSFAPLTDRSWWAFGQFVRHFVFPLEISRLGRLQSRQVFALWRDGATAPQTRRLLGVRQYVSRAWPLLMNVSQATGMSTGSPAQDASEIRRFREGLFATLDWLVRPQPRHLRQRSGFRWAGYADDRSHYDDESLRIKRATVDRWLNHSLPRWVGDLGCNTGEFSRIAWDKGSHVVAIDSDHDSIQSLFLTHAGRPRMYPVLADFGDLCGGRGWRGLEHPGLHSRLDGRCDMVLALAITHHLAVSESIPLGELADFVHESTTRHAIVELVSDPDPQLRLLCSQRGRTPSEFSAAAQKSEFVRAGFRIEESVELNAPGRELLLLARIDAY